MECLMSRLPVPGTENATGATAEIYAHLKKAIGNHIESVLKNSSGSLR